MTTLPSTIPLFPLGEVVLFPQVMLPLHVFEPRYRALVGDAVDGEKMIGMVLIRGVDGPVRPAPPDRPDSPEIYDVGCAGRIAEHEVLEDGRSMIILEGVAKFRIRSETQSDTPYRVASIQTLHEAPAPIEQMREWAVELRDVMDGYVCALTGNAEPIAEVFERKLDLETLINYLCSHLPFSVVEKQGLLQCATPETRYERLLELVRYRTREAELGMEPGRKTDS